MYKQEAKEEHERAVVALEHAAQQRVADCRREEGERAAEAAVRAAEGHRKEVAVLVRVCVCWMG